VSFIFCVGVKSGMKWIEGIGLMDKSVKFISTGYSRSY
jgi:hypothetical protein